MQTEVATSDVIDNRTEAIDGVLIPQENQQALSQHLADNDCEFTNDNAIVFDWLDGKAKTTQASYFSILQTFANFTGNLPIAQWTKQLINLWLNSRKKLGDQTSTLNKKLSCIRSLLGHCVREGYLEKNVAINIPTIKPDKDNKEQQTLEAIERYISPDDVKKMLSVTTKKRDHLAIKLAYQLALRVHEVSNIHWNDLTYKDDGYYRLKVIGKGGKVDFLTVDEGMINELRELNSDGYIFQSQKGNKLSRPQLHRIVKRAVNQAKLDPRISFHWLRHARISHLANNSQFTLEQVRKFARHSSLTITSAYVHCEDEITSDSLVL